MLIATTITEGEGRKGGEREGGQGGEGGRAGRGGREGGRGERGQRRLVGNKLNLNYTCEQQYFHNHSFIHSFMSLFKYLV